MKGNIKIKQDWEEPKSVKLRDKVYTTSKHEDQSAIGLSKTMQLDYCL